MAVCKMAKIQGRFKMKNPTELLKMIESVSPDDVEKLDEIDAIEFERNEK